MRVLQPTRFSYPYSIPRNKKCYTGFDWLRAGRSGNRNPVKARFSAPVQTGTGAHPASCTMGTVSFPGVKRPGRGVNHPPTSSAEVKERVELYLCSRANRNNKKLNTIRIRRNTKKLISLVTY